MAGRVKQKLAILLVDALSQKGAIPFDANKLKLQRPTLSCDCANWYCSVPTKYGISISVYGWNSMTECVRNGLSLSKDKSFYDAYAKLE